MHNVDIKKITSQMADILDQEGLLDPDLLSGLHLVLDEITIEAIEEGLIDPFDIDPLLSELYDAYELYKKKPTNDKLTNFEDALSEVGAQIGPVPSFPASSSRYKVVFGLMGRFSSTLIAL